jgi:hypothetical protein
MPTLFALATFLFLGVLPSPATARTRLAVLIVAEDGALADNLVEVAISHLAQRQGWELIGGHELRASLTAILPTAGLGACVADQTCRAALAAQAQIERAILGYVHQREGCFTIDLTLVDMRTGATEGRSSETVPAEQARLISSVRNGIDRLFASKPAPPELAMPAVPRPPPALAVDRTQADAGPVPSLSSSHAEDVQRNRQVSYLPYVGLGATAGAVVALSAAAVTASFARESLTGSDRAQMQMDLQRREEYATDTNVLLGVGVVCAASAAVVLYRWWRSARRLPLHQPFGEATLTH